MHDYLAARTSFFDRTVTSALGRGVEQVVVGAAGDDGRAFRYAKPGVRWFEVDHPATQRDKLERLGRLGIDASHVRFVAADFTRDPVADRLRAAGLDPDTPGLFLLEGVAVYLEPAVLEDVLGQFRQIAGPGSRLAISVSLSRPRDDGARADSRPWWPRWGNRPDPRSRPARPKPCWRGPAGGSRPLRTTTGRQRACASASARRPAPGRRGPHKRGPHKRGPHKRGPHKRGPRAGVGPATTATPATPAAPRRSALSALLSQALVAFTIEFDNEAEHRLPHRTTSHGTSGDGDATWLVSLAMWENCMRYVTGDPITVGDLEARARTPDQPGRHAALGIHHHRRHREEGTPRPPRAGRGAACHRRRPAGAEIWRPLAGHVEQSWRERFGADRVAGLRDP